MAAPALENLVKFNKKYIAVKPCWSQKKEESYSRKSCSRLSKKDEKPPGENGRDSKAGQATQRRQGDLNRTSKPAGRGLR
jgi:hypothetical protein